MEFVAPPTVMMPPLIVQPYVAPVPASGTEAVLFVESGHTEPAALMVDEGIGLTVMVVAPENVPGVQPVPSETAVTV